MRPHRAARDVYYYNRMYFVSPDLLLASYDKHHLFTYGHEQEAFTPGHRRVVIPYRGARILLQVCYDLRFPVFSRNRGDYDLAIYVANWPQGRQKVWDTLLSARAIENQLRKEFPVLDDADQFKLLVP